MTDDPTFVITGGGKNTPMASRPDHDGPIRAFVELRNEGGSGTRTVRLDAGGRATAERAVELGADESERVEFEFDGDDFPPGVYAYRVSTGDDSWVDGFEIPPPSGERGDAARPVFGSDPAAFDGVRRTVFGDDAALLSAVNVVVTLVAIAVTVASILDRTLLPVAAGLVLVALGVLYVNLRLLSVDR